MIELPDFSPLRVTATTVAPTRATLDGLDHLLVVVARGGEPALARLPYGKQLAAQLARASKNGDDFASSRAANTRATGLTVGAFGASAGFAALTWAAKAVRECLRDKPRTPGIALVGRDASTARTAGARRALGPPPAGPAPGPPRPAPGTPAAGEGAGPLARPR